MELITKKDKRIEDYFQSLNEIKEKVEVILKDYTPVFKGERYITDKDLSEILNISRRSLQEYRNQGVIPYIHLGGKIIYRESDIERILCKHYHSAWR